MRVTSKYFDTLIDVHITAGINIKYIIMHISQLNSFLPTTGDKELIRSFKPIQDRDFMIVTGVFGWWKGIELRYSTDVDKDIVYAVSDEIRY